MAEQKRPDTITELAEKYNIKYAWIAERFGVTKQCVYNWHQGVRKCPVYVVHMMDEILEHEMKNR